MVVSPIGRYTELVSEVTIAIIGNSSLQQAINAMISAPIVESAASVQSFDCQRIGTPAK
jgi:hypothetical protein